MAMTIRVLFFDLDDTLYPSQSVYLKGLRAAWRRLSSELPLSWAEFEGHYSEARSELKDRLGDVPSARNRVLYLKSVVERVLGRSNPALALAAVRAYHQCWKAINPAPVRRALEPLAERFHLGVITNQLADFQLAKMHRIDPFGRLFPILVTSDEMGIEKPDPRLFQEACRRVGCRPDEAVMIGNSWQDDVLGARRAGLHAIYLRLPGQPASKLRAVPTIASLRDIPRALKRLGA